MAPPPSVGREKYTSSTISRSFQMPTPRVANEKAGDFWLQNESGVIMQLKAKREGLTLSLGVDAVAVKMS